jgi:hypothetical protein
MNFSQKLRLPSQEAEATPLSFLILLEALVYGLVVFSPTPRLSFLHSPLKFRHALIRPLLEANLAVRKR